MKALKELLTTPTTQLGRASRLAVFQIKLWSHCIRLLKRNRAGQQAAALSYYTIFGLVPLAIVALLVFQSFPGYEDTGVRLKNFAYKAGIGVMPFILSSGLALVIAMITVSLQSVKAAIADPVDALHYE